MAAADPDPDFFGLTDPGRQRGHNEDQFLIADLDKSALVRSTSLLDHDHVRLFGGPRGHLLVVADGIGGSAGGERASGVATRTLVKYVLTTMPWFFRAQAGDHDEAEDALKDAVEACQVAVAAAAASEPGHERMGTTLTLAYVLWPRLYVVHAGDSRAYLLRAGDLHQLTHDHTVAQRMVDAGAMTPEQAARSRLSHVLSKCVSGARPGVGADVYRAVLQPGDTLLLCSDGLSNEVPDADIAALLAAGTAEEAARRLVAAANDAGGKDNITVVVARFPME